MSNGGYPHGCCADRAGGIPDQVAALIFRLSREDFDRTPLIQMDSVYCSPGGIAAAVLHASHRLMMPGTQSNLDVKFSDAGAEGLRTTSVQLKSYNVKAAVITGLPAAAPLFDAIKAGKNEIAFMEMLACPAGCVSGGGQPKVLLPQDKDRAYALRAEQNALPDGTTLGAIAAHPAVLRMYQEYFGKPCGDKSNRFLQTQYEERTLEK
jgi:iron only hydrogenase large subunit-like protein